MKKKIKYLLFIVLCNFFAVNVYASSASITAHSSSSKVQVGQTVKVTVTVSSSAPLGSWEFNVGYDSKVLSYVSSNLEGGLSSANYVLNSNTKNKTYTLTFKAKAEGVGKVTINNAAVWGYDENSMSTSVSNASITVETARKTSSNNNSNTTTPKSSNNYLSTLTVGDKQLSPKFDKNTTNYSLSLENSERNITVSATAEDKKSTVTGTGTKTLQEGNNKIEITVTAENGSKKTYTINVNVKEKDPVIVNVDGQEYTVVQKLDEIEPPTTYTPTTTVINNTEVPALKSSITDYTLVALTSPTGNTNLYIYSDDTYTLYKEYKFSGVLLYIKEPTKEQMIKKTKETTITVDGEEVKAYKLNKNTYPLVFGLNIETGEENWYTYDESEKTLQKFVSGNVNSVSDSIDVSASDSIKNISVDSKYKTLSYLLCGIVSVLFIFLLASAIKLSTVNNFVKKK